MAVSKVSALLLVGALASGSGAAYMTDSHIKERIDSYQQKLDAEYEPVPVVVAAQDLRAGDLMTQANLAIRKVPSNFIHGDTVRPDNAEAIIGHRVVYPINAGEPVLAFHAAQSRGAGFSNLITKGQRALTFPVDTVSSMSGMLRPGDKIDLLATVRDGDMPVTLPLLTDVSIIAVGKSVDEFDQEGNPYQTITLLVGPEDAAKIIHAREVAQLTTVLRGPSEAGSTFNSRITMNTLLGRSEKVPKPPGVRRKPVEIIIGGQ